MVSARPHKRKINPITYIHFTSTGYGSTSAANDVNAIMGSESGKFSKLLAAY